MASFAFAFLFLLFLSFQPNSSIANITLTSSLTTNDNSPWLSPSQDFAFGFRPAPNSNLFLLAIWLYKIPESTIIWHAIGDNSINPAVPAGSKVELTASNLVLTDPNGLPIWTAEAGSTISYAAMLDTGNFVLAGSDSYLWDSFKHPTDTILPSQTLNSGDMLFSRLTATNYSKGRFQLHFRNGSLQLNPIGWPGEFQYDPYYSSNTYSANTTESGNQLVFSESAYIYIVKSNGDTAQIPGWNNGTTTTDYYYRATLDFDGVFTQYAHPKNSRNSSGNDTWFYLNLAPEDICGQPISDFGSGPCGYNSYCSLEKSRPSCYCPPGFHFADPQNRFEGCIPNFPQGCGQDDGSRAPEELFEIKRADNINWPLNDYERLEPYDQIQCEDSCLHDCSCAVAIFGGNTCWKKRLPLSNGRTAIGASTTLVKVRKEVPSSGCSNSNCKSEKSVVLGTFLGCSAVMNLLLLVLSPPILFKMNKRRLQIAVQDPKIFEPNLHSFSYGELEEATDCFQEELGRGSFGVVYKGVLKYGSRNVIAVKKLDKFAEEREREFRTEVSAIGKTHHKNLVRLLGYCIEGSNRLLIYEFMSNGTLANFLFTHPRPNWHQRVRVALAIARGLLYLHEECNLPIIHCDIKPQNILLDDHLNARISDFGLAKLLLSDQSRTHTMIRGTRGYVAPEWFKNVPVTTKVDVYSFGVLLLEITCCRKCVQMEPEEEERAILTDWAYDCYVEGRIDLLVDNDEMAMSDMGRLQSWAMTAFWCIQEDPSKRPTMKMVMEMLEGFVEVPSPTCPSSF